MSIDSLFAWLPVKFYLSLPAKSTNYNLDTIILSGYLLSTCSTVRVRTECDLEEALFILWEATTLFLIPKWYKASISSGDLHSKAYKFST